MRGLTDSDFYWLSTIIGKEIFGITVEMHENMHA